MLIFKHAYLPYLRIKRPKSQSYPAFIFLYKKTSNRGK